jgi:hypothetical protein
MATVLRVFTDKLRRDKNAKGSTEREMRYQIMAD